MPALLLAAVALTASSKLSARDVHVLARLHQNDAAEVELGRLAKTQAASEDVKNFGALVAKDHTFLDRQVLRVAGGQLPPLIPADDEEREEMNAREDVVARLKALKGEPFDRLFTDSLVRWHREDITALEAQRSLTQEPPVYALLGKILPVLREHRSIAEKLTRSLRNG